MAKKRREESINLGDIVEIIESANKGTVGSLGEVVELGQCIKVAVVHVLSFEPKQIRKKLDVAALSWNDLRKLAKKLGLPASGKRHDLEARIKRQLKYQGRVECAEPVGAAESSDITERTARARSTRAVSPRFEVNEPVKVKPTARLFPNHEGFVHDPGPPKVEVFILIGGNPREEVTLYDEDDLISLA